MYRAIREISRCFSSVARQKNVDSKKLQNSSYTVRSVRSEDIPELAELARENFFQFPVSSLKFWSQLDPDGIKVAVNQVGKVVGVCSTVKNSENLYFGGMFIVQEKSRDADVGRKLTNECHEHAGNSNIGVNCSRTKMGLFKRRGVEIIETDWKSLEYETYNPVKPCVLSDDLPAGVEILPFQASYMEAVLTYDRLLVGYERRSTIETSCTDKECNKTLVAMKDGRCVGFGSIKLNILGLGRVGPLYADDASIAEAMVKRLITDMPEANGFTMVTVSSNILGNMILEKLQIPVHDNIYRLYKKEKLKVDTNKIFAHFDIDFSFF
ncbi:hypothetical protein HNY73_002582 [Argiope bruennichi]|uniref:N-acetyltransferase domain-containing protein n=1 Tax=Argiope bruennichi TaxID=94029 RepID=A0A8T0FWG7_ARGBR|nr:hypothetical protein HNY73_002582 [Argiope bruennichi]